MIKAANLEPTNSINAELSWKTVRKGFRSASRRPRKPTKSLSMGVQHDDKGSKEESSVTESEELGVAVLGHRFSDKIDHLPIKKRRPLQESPSPSRTPLDGTCASVSDTEMAAFNGPMGVQSSRGSGNAFVHRNLPCTEDSYGIELLAAAACNTSITDDVHNGKASLVEEKISIHPEVDPSIYSTSLERITACSQKGKPFEKDSASEDHDDSRHQINSPAVPPTFHDKSDSEAGKCSTSVKDVRLHWDLNTVMDEWELPSENLNSGSPKNGSQDIPGEGLLSGEREELESYVRHRDPEHALELPKCTSDIKVSAQVVSKLNCVDSCHYPGFDPISGRSPSKGNMNTSTTKVILQAREHCCTTSAMQLGQTLSLGNVPLGEQDVVVVDPVVSEKGVCEMVTVKCKEYSTEMFDLPNSRNSIADLISMQPDAEDPSSKSGKVGSSHFSDDREKMSMLGITFEEGQTNMDDVGENQDKTVPGIVSTPAGSSSDVELKELRLKSYERFGEVALEDILDDGDVSDISLGGHDHLVSLGKITKYQTGCESPVEDGELRESVAHSWAENEGETECLDYDMDDRDADDSGTANHCMSAGSDSNQIDNNGNLTENVMCGRVDASKESGHPGTIGNTAGQDQLPEHHVSRTVEARNVKPEDIVASDSIHEFDVKGSVAEKRGSSAIRGKVLTLVQGTSVSDALDGKGTIDTQQGSSGSGFQTGQVFRSDKYFGRDRLAPRMQDGIQKINQDGAVASNWDSRNHYQNGYRRGGGHPRPRSSIIPDSVANVDGLAYDEQRRSTDYSFKGVSRPHVRRRPPDNIDNAMHRESIATRDDSHYRSRGRSGFYRRGFVKGHRDEYHDPDDPAPSSAWVPHTSARRQCNSSPVFSRDTNFSRPSRKSRSRSRTRSPIPWHLQKERNVAGRRLSRSPDFRSETRMERSRMHYDDSKFAPNGDVFLSPPRRRLSSQGNSGWFNDRDCVPTRFRERNSPGRYFGQRQRFGSNGTVGRMKSDDCFRPRINSERFSELSGGGWREHNYDGSDGERTRFNGKHEMIRRVRHSDAGGAGRRFRSDAEDGFEDHYNRNEYNNCIRRTEKSDILGKAWEGRGHFKYDSERMYATSSKLPGIRDYDDDESIGRG